MWSMKIGSRANTTSRSSEPMSSLCSSRALPMSPFTMTMWSLLWMRRCSWAWPLLWSLLRLPLRTAMTCSSRVSAVGFLGLSTRPRIWSCFFGKLTVKCSRVGIWSTAVSRLTSSSVRFQWRHFSDGSLTRVLKCSLLISCPPCGTMDFHSFVQSHCTMWRRARTSSSSLLRDPLWLRSSDANRSATRCSRTIAGSCSLPPSEALPCRVSAICSRSWSDRKNSASSESSSTSFRNSPRSTTLPSPWFFS
mmetsp:Transcript_76478/g.199369  ORF Transcript_76478/g.199369 Transcript_76478/m.199369 type:complete len:249 (-) Transcript_76478:987-1733(-)